MFTLLTFITIAGEIIWQFYVKYPPTLEQLQFVALDPTRLWLVRLVSFGLIVICVKLISKYINSPARKYFYMFCFLPPVIGLIWLSHPIEAVKIFLVVLVGYYSVAKIKKPIWIAVMAVLSVIFVNVLLFKEKPTILNEVSFKKSQEEISFRINIEDTTNPRIELPLKLRRVAYNKYFFSLKNLIKTSLGFFDFETLFFQDVHPMGQKGFIIYTWPVLLIFLASVYLVKRYDPNTINILIFLSISAYIYFMLSNASTDRRLALLVFPIAIILSKGLEYGFSNKTKGLKFGALLLLWLSIYAWGTNLIDRSIRPEHWLDNRPIAQQFVFETIKNSEVQFSNIILPETLYAYKYYCGYYKVDCSLFEIRNFNIVEENINQNNLYVGFTGNFVGQSNIGIDQETVMAELQNKNIRVIGVKHILDNIASGFGQELVVGQLSK